MIEHCAFILLLENDFVKVCVDDLACAIVYVYCHLSYLSSIDLSQLKPNRSESIVNVDKAYAFKKIILDMNLFSHGKVFLDHIMMF